MRKFQPEEFIVEEITGDGEALEVDKNFAREGEPLKSQNYFFSHFVLQKRLWTTGSAVREIADRLHVSPKRLNFAGNKDRNALTAQMCSAFAVQPSQLLALNIKDMKILGAWLSNGKVKLGDLAGNRFTIALNGDNIGKKEIGKLGASKIRKKLEKQGYAIPNYFGEQRFGSARRNTAEVGKLLIQGKFKEAVLNYLTFTDENEKDENAREARRRLAKEMNFRDALHYFPHFLKIEKLMLSHLVKFPNDYLGAFRKLHRSLQLLFIHAYQSHLFNIFLGKRVKGKKLLAAKVGDHYCGLDANGFPEDQNAAIIDSKEKAREAQGMVDERKAVLLGKLIGFQSRLDADEEKLLKKEGLEKGDFFLRSTPELSCRGALRPNFVFLGNFECGEMAEGGRKELRLRFELPAGSYATVALKEIIG